MYKDFMDIRKYSGLDERYRRYVKDRKDLYRACGEAWLQDCFGMRIFYECVEVNCNPDIDW